MRTSHSPLRISWQDDTPLGVLSEGDIETLRHLRSRPKNDRLPLLALAWYDSGALVSRTDGGRRDAWNPLVVREETLAAFNLYCRTPFGRLHARNPEIIQLAGVLGRSVNAVAMKCWNLAAFDPALRSRGIKGLSKASRLDREVWELFERDPEQTGFQSEARLAEIMDRPLRQAETVEWEDVAGWTGRRLQRCGSTSACSAQ